MGRRDTENLTIGEKRLVKQYVAEMPGGVSVREATSLAKALNRPKEMIIAAIEEARNKFILRASRYVDIHMQAAEQAIEDGDNETAGKLSQWAIENISGEGKRIVNKQVETGTGAKVFVGIKLGGVNEQSLVKIDE